MARLAKIDRETKETNISIELNLDGFGQHHIGFGIVGKLFVISLKPEFPAKTV